MVLYLIYPARAHEAMIQDQMSFFEKSKKNCKPEVRRYTVVGKVWPLFTGGKGGFKVSGCRSDGGGDIETKKQPRPLTTSLCNSQLLQEATGWNQQIHYFTLTGLSGLLAMRGNQLATPLKLTACSKTN